jgi:aryl-alcohol dehydrogenase-like predicted oxidoreductase
MRQRPGDPKPPSPERRDFLKVTTAAVAGLLASRVLPDSTLPARAQSTDATAGATLSKRKLGRIGYDVGLFSLGGQAAIEKSDNEEVAVAIVERALDLGVNYVDTAARYGSGVSQRYIGKVMKRRRREVFLATKSHDRTRDGSLRLLEESLRVLETDHLDLWQLHNLARMEEVERIFAPGGAIEAFVEARDQKLVRHLGVTGHADPHVLAEAIRRFPFDTVLMAVNAADKHYLSFIDHLLPLAVEKQMGIIGMKIPARGRILAPAAAGEGPARNPGGGSPGPGVTMREAMHYVLSLPVSTIIVGCDSVAQLEENVQLARDFEPLDEEYMAALVDRTQPIHKQALFFRNWG